MRTGLSFYRIISTFSLLFFVGLFFYFFPIIPIQAATTATFNVAAGPDDVRYAGPYSESLSTTDNSCPVGVYNLSTRTWGCAVRFTGINIPRGSAINSAYISFVVANAGTGTNLLTKVYAENADNAAQITSAADFLGRAVTAGTDWDITSPWTVAATYNSPSISSEIQTVVNRAGWVSGNAMNIFWRNDGSGLYQYRFAASWNSTAYTEPRLTISWTEPGGGGDTTPPFRSNGSPTGTLSAGTTQATLTLTTDEAANCRYSITAGTGYGSMTNTFSTTGGTSHSTTVTGLTNGSSYNYYVRCQDAIGNPNTDDYPISFSVAPTPSSKFIIGDRVQTNTSLNVRATPSTSGTLLGTQTLGSRGTVVGGPQFADTYWWWQIDYDAAPDGWSVEDGLDKFTDTAPPVRSNGAPTGTLAAGTTQATLTLTTDEAANCRYSTIAGTGYGSMTNTFSTTGGTSHSTTVTGLTNGSSYNYYVRCQDAIGNPNTDDYPISFSVVSAGSLSFSLIGDITTEETALGLVNYNGNLYIATHTNPKNNGPGRIIKYNDSTGYGLEYFIPLDSQGLGDIRVLNGKIYVMVIDSSTGVGYGEIYVYNGTTWQYVTTNPIGAIGLLDIDYYNNRYYIAGYVGGTPTLYSSLDGATGWSSAYTYSYGGEKANRFSQAVVFNGKLYFTPQTSNEGNPDPVVKDMYMDKDIFVYDGTTFSPLEFTTEPRETTDMQVFNNTLYISVWSKNTNVTGLWRTIDGVNFSQVAFFAPSPTKTPRLTDLVIYDNALYAAEYQPGTPPTVLLYKSTDGIIWTQADSLAATASVYGESSPWYVNAQMGVYQRRLFVAPPAEGKLYASSLSSDGSSPVRSSVEPSGILPAGTTQTTISLFTNENAVCNLSSSSGSAFSLMPSTFAVTGGTSHSTQVTGLTDGQTYNYYVRCQDTVDNANTDDYAISFSVAPTPSSKFIIGDRVQTNSNLNVRATPSTSGTLLGTQTLGSRGTVTGGPQFADTYWWWQIDYDAAPDGWSVEDGLDKVTDTAPPVRSNGAPTGTLAAGTTQATFTLTTDEAANCRYSIVAGTSYSSMPDTFTITGGTSHSTQVTGLTNGYSYNYYVRCIDAASNPNTDDYLISFSVAPTPSTKFIIGDRVQTNSNLNVRATPSTSGTLLGTQTLGSRGTVTGGPQFADTYWWWQIDYDAAPDGWSVEDGLDKAVQGSTFTYTFSVMASADDVLRFGAASFSSTNGSCNGTYISATSYSCAVRFASINIPKGSIINSAYLTFNARGSSSGGTITTNLYLENADNPARIASASDFDGRSLTSPVAWNNIENWVSGVNYNSVSIAGLVQTVVNRAGWVSGNAMNVFWKNNGSTAVRNGDSYNGDIANPPRLTISWTEP